MDGHKATVGQRRVTSMRDRGRDGVQYGGGGLHGGGASSQMGATRGWEELAAHGSEGNGAGGWI